MPIREDQKQAVLDATDIVELIGEHLALQRRGREWVALCPFHDDSKPSLTVSPEKRIFKCFACGAGGDVYSWMIRYQRMTFPEALKYLADRAGIKLTEHRLERGDEGQDLLEVHRLATEWFRDQWAHADAGRVARRYVEQRRVSPEMCETFGIGCAPDRWDGLVSAVRRNGWDPALFQRAGLIVSRQNGDGYYDRFRHRLIFPITDALGRPIAFGGRRLRDEDEPKYLNSPETDLFNKSSTLYGLHVATQAIIAQRTAVVVEGYTDVIACHQAGVPHVVATLGTALTAQHVRQMKRFAERVVLIFDPDEAGQNAADRAAELFLTGDLDVAIADLPDGVDPAELLTRPDGLDTWRSAISQATDALAYLFQRMGRQLDEADTVSGRQRVAEEYVRRLAGLGLRRQSPMRRAMIVQHLSRLLHLGQNEIVAMLLEKGRKSTPAPTADNLETSPSQRSEAVALSETAPKIMALRRAERHLIGVLLREPNLFDRVLIDDKTLHDLVQPSDMLTDDSKRLYDRICKRIGHDGRMTLVDLLADLAQENEQELADLATGAEAEVERLCQDSTQDSEDQLVTACRGAAETIRSHHRSATYDRTRDSLVGAAAVAGGDAQDRLLREVVEQRRANMRPSHIGRSSTE